MLDAPSPNDLAPFWMPFTANRQFKSAPRMLTGAKGMHYTTQDGRQVIDGTAGLWCCNAGHGDPRIVKAIQDQAAELDYAPAFQMGHPKAFELASRLATMMPGDLDHVFFTNSGSESVDTALKIALAYHRANGEASRTRLIGRERGYHGVGFGGISVGGIVNNRRFFGSLLAGVDHMRHTHLPEQNAFSRGQPEHGAELADDLERLVALHGGETIAAVIVEPMAGSTGVLMPPKGYLERLRAICDKHGILLIFDEVITGFGRLGSSFACEHFGVQPDIVTTAKGLTSGTVPMGAVMVRKHIYDAFMHGPETAIELFHGYTYSAHPLACNAALATLDVYRDDQLFERSAEMAPYWEEAVHSLKGLPHVIDLRNMGLIAGIELEPIPGQPTKRAFEAFLKCYEKGVMTRTTGDIIALSPPLIIEKSHIDQIFETIADVLKTID
ncbi:Omega-amino acid--pyruvate aminotransferase [Caenispirillum salinarum AK4]|uniref:Omega-amino acid--pyruvate aminotransferase n=1 Tax=Caenispirillum salinarum AK4 TaxID=1238182 RepID=K9H3M3_9PROT|nr:aspartate aminotransferase family protein [Caenispirillum salinarum]EKV31629.1 Omega-amino acid--pyruvate aminotransferase [Caenispirillum salinarum AK4]